MVKNNLNIFHTSFSSSFLLHCYGQSTSISHVLFRSFCSQQFLFKCLFLIETRELLVSWSFPQMAKKLENLSYKFFVFISVALLRSSYFNFLRSFQILLFLTNFIQMTSLNQHEKGTLFMEFSVNGKK